MEAWLITALPISVTVLIALLVGILIGAIGIGGVLLVPSLTYVLGLEIHIAIATSVFTFMFSGMIGAFEYARRDSINWKMAVWLCAGCMPGAFLGAATAWLMPAVLLQVIVGLLVIFSGLQALRRTHQLKEARVNINRNILILIGFLTGFGSPITGTGGPLILVPIMIWMKSPVLMAVGLSQVIQIPIALLATISNMTFGEIDFQKGFGLAFLLMLGVLFGARIAHIVSREKLKVFIAIALLFVGVFMMIRTISNFFC